MTLKKVYELALTAIAYLAFGIFVLQVIMCITAVTFLYNYCVCYENDLYFEIIFVFKVKTHSGMTMMMMPTDMEGMEMGEVEEGRAKRQKRSTTVTFSEVNLFIFKKTMCHTIVFYSFR